MQQLKEIILKLKIQPIIAHIVNKMYFDDSSLESEYMWHNLHTYFVEMGDLCPPKHCSILNTPALPVCTVTQLMYDPFRSWRFYSNEHETMFCICLSVVSILYVCTGCCVLFVSCNKKCLECIFCHFHVVSLSFC